MIIVTVTYPAYKNKPAYTKEFVFEQLPTQGLHSYLAKKMDGGRIIRTVVSNGDQILWDSDRDEDWF